MRKSFIRSGTYVRTKRSKLKSLASRTTGKYTQGGRPKNCNRPEPSMPKLQFLDEPLPE
jgi:hypothetical protein